MSAILCDYCVRLFPRCVFLQQVRTTFVLKRRHNLPLPKKEHKQRPFRERHHLYDFVEFKETRPHENINVILRDYVEGVGLKGEEVSVRKLFARNHLLLPKLAVYATEENRLKYKMSLDDELSAKREHSSKTAGRTMKFLSKSVVLLKMNLDEPWTIEPWHVKASLRKAGVIVPDHAITLPNTPITGPNLDLEGKCFLVTVMINGLEKAIVRCRIHHWHASIGKRLPRIQSLWQAPLEPIFDEDTETLTRLPAPPGSKW